MGVEEIQGSGLGFLQDLGCFGCTVWGDEGSRT